MRRKRDGEVMGGVVEGKRGECYETTCFICTVVERRLDGAV